MLSALRKRSGGIVVKSLLILLIISFGAWGIQDWLNPAISGNAVVTIGEEEIGPVEINRRVSQEMNRLRPLFGGQLTQKQALNFGIIDGIIAEEVDQALLDQGARALGVSISDDMISQDIRTQANFKGLAGNFDRDRFNQILVSNGLTESGYVNIVRRSLAGQQYKDSFQSGARAPQVMVDAVYRYRNEKRVVEVALIKDSFFTDVGEPDASQIEAFHTANAKQFTAPEYRKTTYLSLEAKDLVSEIAVSEEEIVQAYESHVEEFVTQEKRHILQMVLADEDMAKKAHAELLNGRDFAVVAKEIGNIDEATLDLGSLTKSDLLPELVDPAFALMQGTITAPVKSALGWHLMKVTEIEAGGTKTIDQVRDQLKNGVAIEKAVDSLYDLSRNLEDQLGGGATLEEAANSINFKVVTIAAIDAAGKDLAGNVVPNVPAGQAFLQTIFSTEEGEESQLVEAGPEGFFVVRVDGVTAPALRPVDTIRAPLIEAWKAKQRSDKSKVLAEKLLADVRAGKVLPNVVDGNALVVTQSKPFTRDDRGADSGLSNDLVKKVFDLQSDQAVAGQAAEGYQVVVLKSIEEANPSSDKAGVDGVRNALSVALKNDVTVQLTEALREDIGVDINRPMINQLFNGDAQTR